VNVLWVEDQLQDNQVYADALAGDESRPQIKYAASVAEALVSLAAQEFDVVVLDLNLPLGREAPASFMDTDTNGAYVAKHLRETGRLARTRVVCLTNFYHRAQEALGEGVKIVNKGAFARDFVRVVVSGG
jgi:CheY-like chemotaxis protein